MGIRHYAYPVAPEDTEAAAADPERFLGCDPLADAWGLVPHGDESFATGAKPVPEMLYLDTCWSHLQRLTDSNGHPDRPSHRLVEGHVSLTIDGWIPHIAALSPDAVAAAAHDLATYDEGDVDRMLAERPADTLADERSYVLEFLRRAQEFTDRLSRDGRGLVYMIG